MYKCDDCGSTFDEPEIVSYCKEEYNGVADLFGHQTWGTYDACPDCGSEDFERFTEDDDEEECM